MARRERKQLKQFPKPLFIAGIVLLLCIISLYSKYFTEDCLVHHPKIEPEIEALWAGADSDGWRPSSVSRSSYWPPPPDQTNGYLLVGCNGGLNQQRSAICNAVVAARIMNATLVLPKLLTADIWHDEGGFRDIYDVDHFIKSLKEDVRIVESMPINVSGKPLKAFQIDAPRHAPLSWYETFALEKMKEHGAIFLNPYSHRMAEEIGNSEYQRLRCRVNFHALRFKEEAMQLSNKIIRRLKADGPFMAIHLRFEIDMLAYAGCFGMFKPQEQAILKIYREKYYAPKVLNHDKSRRMGKCPLSPEEVGLTLQGMGFNNATRIYLAAGDIFGGESYMKPLRTMFPHLENRTTILTPEELEDLNSEKDRGLLESAVDYMVCLMADIFMPTYDGPSNFDNNLLGHRLYNGFQTTIRPDRKALAPIFIDREKGKTMDFNERVKAVMQGTNSGGPYPRIYPEYFNSNPWPECFCKRDNLDEACPLANETQNDI